MIASLTAVVTLGLSTAALSLAEPGPAPRHVNAALLPSELISGDVTGGALELDPVGPVDPRPEPDPEPEPEPEPEPTDTGTVIVLKPGETAGSIDAAGRLTGSATFDAWGDDQDKIVLIIAGRTIDESGMPVPGVIVEVGLDASGLRLETKRLTNRLTKKLSLEREDIECVPCCRRPCRPPDPNMYPTVTGFSDKFGCYRLQLTYYASAGSCRQAWVQAIRGGYTPCALQGVDLGSDAREDLDITMAKAASISGRVVDERSMPIAGVVVYAYGELSSTQATTGEDGSFTIEDVAAGEIYLCCYSETCLWEGDGGMTLQIRSGEASRLSTDIQLTTRTTASLELRMLGGEQADWISGVIEFRDNEGALVHTAWFDCARDEAAYQLKTALDYLPAGSWDMRVHVSGEKNWKGELRVSTGANTQNDLGTIYLDETDEVPANMLKKCCG